MLSQSYKIPKMACGNCFNIIRAALSKMTGVKSVGADIGNKIVTVEFDETALKSDEIVAKLSKVGFPPQ